ncbi:hypothetical protein DAPPUDRAFT_238323 [Daphnia pulex]|uniref:Uncharacterized protein n=1 Tax=Daphnia pulex TaxID=6669 RepID=E9G646_DAPPU|nr:hypothetical protein DAPPUDRAFT_238323 [Daphnia pulex]|eukprot:EFX84872.1 hypothetical protein DAPPUDRAFT_238323 [Daphnia pulex]
MTKRNLPTYRHLLLYLSSTLQSNSRRGPAVHLTGTTGHSVHVKEEDKPKKTKQGIYRAAAAAGSIVKKGPFRMRVYFPY